MKTASRSSGKANFGRAVILMALAIVVGSTGCQKEDELMPSGNNSISQSGARTGTVDLNNNITYYTLDRTISIDEALAQISNRTKPTSDQLANSNTGTLAAINFYNIIKIDHVSGGTDLPDYIVLVRSDGWVVFDGHLNVRVLERIAFKINDATLTELRRIFDLYSFNYIVPDFRVTSDMPVVYTSYQLNQLQRPRTIYDDYKNNPSKLILIRESVEKVLGIGNYVSNQWPVQFQEPSF